MLPPELIAKRIGSRHGERAKSRLTCIGRRPQAFV